MTATLLAGVLLSPGHSAQTETRGEVSLTHVIILFSVLACSSGPAATQASMSRWLLALALASCCVCSCFAACPPQGYDSMTDLDINKFLQGTWYSQQQVCDGPLLWLKMHPSHSSTHTFQARFFLSVCDAAHQQPNAASKLAMGSTKHAPCAFLLLAGPDEDV